MSTEKELMKLVADYGKECISAGIAEMSLSDALKQRMAEDVRTAHVALTDRLRAILSELEESREDAARYRWLRNRMLGVDFDWCENGITALVFEMPDGCAYGGDCDQNIDAARKGEA